MAPLSVSVLLALVGTAQAELAFRVEAPNGMGWYQPSGVCKIALLTRTYEKLSCDTTSAATMQTYAATDPECTGTVQDTKAFSLPHSDGGMQWTCEDISSDGYVRVNSYTAADCNTASMCETQLFATGVCAVLSQPALIGGTINVSSTMHSQDGKMVLYLSNDCSGVGLVMATSDTCNAEAAKDESGGVCDGKKGFQTFAATKTASVTAPTPLPTPASMIVHFEPASGGMPSHEPTGQCNPDFKDGTNIIESYSKTYCASLSVAYQEKYFASDSACSGLMISSFPMMMPQVLPGSVTMTCVNDTSDGFTTMRHFTEAGCGSGLCNVNRFATGVCNVFSTPMDLGFGNVNSMKFTQDLKTSYYASNDCTGNALMEPTETAGCATTKDNQTCNDGSAGYPQREASSAPLTTRLVTTTIVTTTTTTVATTTTVQSSPSSNATNETTNATTTVAAAVITTVAPTGVASSALLREPSIVLWGLALGAATFVL